jgi:DNA polymerase III sliding clamp (beta) subunit (PCNA family)
MIASISLTDFKEILSFLSKFSSDIQNFTLQARQNSVEGTFLSSICAAKIRKEAKVNKEGRFNLGRLGSLAKAFHGMDNKGTVTLEKKDSSLILKSDQFLFKLNENKDEIIFPEVTFQSSTSLSMKEFKKALQAALPFAGGQLNSILFECEDQKLKIISSDGYRLNFLELKTLEPSSWRKLLAPSILWRLVKTLGNSGTIRLLPSERFLCVSFEDKIIALGVLEEKYPDYKRIMQQEGFQPFKVSIEPLLQALSAGSAFTEKIKLQFKEDSVKLSASSEQGTFDFDIQGQGSIQNLTIAFNPNLFKEAIEAFDGEELELRLKSPLDKCIITKGKGHQHFLMPIHEE